MKIRLTFFSGLITSIALFMIFLIGFMIFSFNQPIELVTKNYYSEDLAYQEQIDRIARTILLDEQPGAVYTVGRGVDIQFPVNWQSEDIRGWVHLYRPSDLRLDQRFELNLDDEGRQWIPVPRLVGGLWLVKLSWEMNNLEYYTEIQLIAAQ